MFILSLIASPANANLEPALVDRLRRQWNGGAARWLGPGVAAEFPVPAIPVDLDQMRGDLAGVGIDVNAVPEDGRRKRLLLADMDSTMIGQECIDELAALAGVGERVAGITARAMNGELDFESALRERVGLLAGQPETIIQDVLATRVTLASGGRELLATMRANGAHTALVSGGFTAFTAAIAGQLGFHEHHANTLLAENGVLTGKVAHPILGREAKVEALDRITAALGITAQDVIAVGDGANDLGMLTRGGMGVALHAKPVVAAQAGVQVNHGDLTALLFLQGYSADEFVKG